MLRVLRQNLPQDWMMRTLLRTKRRSTPLHGEAITSANLFQNLFTGMNVSFVIAMTLAPDGRKMLTASLFARMKTRLNGKMSLKDRRHSPRSHLRSTTSWVAGIVFAS